MIDCQVRFRQVRFFGQTSRPHRSAFDPILPPSPSLAPPPIPLSRPFPLLAKQSLGRVNLIPGAGISSSSRRPRGGHVRGLEGQRMPTCSTILNCLRRRPDFKSQDSAAKPEQIPQPAVNPFNRNYSFFLCVDFLFIRAWERWAL